MGTDKRFSVLIADDDPNTWDAIGVPLERAGFKAICPTEQNEIPEIVETELIDVVVIDITMPIVGKLKFHSKNSPIIFFTTKSAKTTVKEAYDLGGEALFPKPLDIEALIDAIRTSQQFRKKRGTRKCERFEVEFPLEITPTEGDPALQATVRNISREGMYVDLAGKELRCGDKLRFKIDPENKTLPSIEGSGTVCWVVQWKRNSTIYPSKTGFGVEFTNLDETSNNSLLLLLNLIKTKAFVPLKNRALFLW